MVSSSSFGLPAAPPPRSALVLNVIVRAPSGVDERRIRRVLEHAGCSVVDSEVDGDVRPDAVLVVAAGAALDEPVSEAVRDADGAPVVVLSGRDGRAAVEEAVTAGATGFVSEKQLETRLGATVYATAAGQLTVPSEHREIAEPPILSRREKQVLSLVVLGLSNVEIASKLHVTEATVKSHLSSAYRKLGARSRHEATDMILSNRRLGLGILTLSGERGPD